MTHRIIFYREFGKPSHVVAAKNSLANGSDDPFRALIDLGVGEFVCG